MKANVMGYWPTVAAPALKDLSDARPPIEGLGLAIADWF